MNRNQVIKELAKNHPSGSKLVEVSREELSRIHGGGDVQPETTPICAFGSGVALGLSLSKIYC
ncbi:mersacidin family lantibiotic [Bacillus cereus]